MYFNYTHTHTRTNTHSQSQKGKCKSVCVIRPPHSLSFTLVHTQKHLHKRKSDCFNFHPCPPPLVSLSSPVPCRDDLHALFVWLFYADTVLSSRTPTPASSPPTKSLHKHSWQEANSLPWHSRVLSNKSLNPPASRPLVCVFKTQLWSVCEHKYILWLLHLYACRCVKVVSLSALYYSFSNYCVWLFLMPVVPSIERRLLITTFKRKTESHDWLIDLAYWAWDPSLF